MKPLILATFILIICCSGDCGIHNIPYTGTYACLNGRPACDCIQLPNGLELKLERVDYIMGKKHGIAAISFTVFNNSEGGQTLDRGMFSLTSGPVAFGKMKFQTYEPGKWIHQGRSVTHSDSYFVPADTTLPYIFAFVNDSARTEKKFLNYLKADTSFFVYNFGLKKDTLFSISIDPEQEQHSGLNRN